VAVGVLGGLTLAAGKDFKRKQDEFNENPPQRADDEPEVDLFPHDAQTRFEEMQRVTNVMIGVSAGLAMLTLVVGAVAFTRPRNTGTSRASTRAQWLFHGSGLVVRY
jgi:hypothetical protein